MQRLTIAYYRAMSALGAIRAELLTSFAVVIGWALVTWGIAALTVWQVYPLSAGLFLLSLAGWRFLGKLFAAGLYTLTREERRRG